MKRSIKDLPQKATNKTFYAHLPFLKLITETFLFISLPYSEWLFFERTVKNTHI